jgi:glycosyltransferase involved in cell wall biosynthesis
VGLWTWEVVRRLADSCDVIVCGPRQGSEAALQECEGVRFIRFPITFDMFLLNFYKRFGSKSSASPDFASNLYRRIFAERAALAFRSYSCSVIHILNLSQFVPIMRRFNPRSRIILHMECDWLAGLERGVMDRELSEVNVIVGCSDYITDAIRKRFPHYSDRCATIYNAVDVAAFVPRSEAERSSSFDRVIFINRLSPEKGLHVLLEAFRRVLTHRPSATLQIIGPDDTMPLDSVTSVRDNPAVNRLSRFFPETYPEISSLGYLYPEDYPHRMRRLVSDDPLLRRQVTFAGPIQHTQLARCIDQAGILVQPSVFDEPFGIQIVEAMASGIPVVASAAGGIPELVVDGKTGILVERDNPDALAAALLRLMDDPALAKEMGIAGRRRAEEKFCWERITRELKDCFFAPLQSSLMEPQLPSSTLAQHQHV